MKTAFETKSLTIDELFRDAKSFYQMPVYQRPYRWKDKEIDALWDDLMNAYDKNETDYFLGAFVLAKPERGRYSNVIDGQQRLTTLTILFCIIRDCFPNFNQNADDEDELATTNQTIEDSIFGIGGERIRFRTHYSAQSDFAEYITKKGATEQNYEKPSNKELNKENPKYKFINAVVNIKEKLEELSEHKDSNKFSEFIDFIFRKVQIVSINCVNEDTAITLFQVINTAGLDLAPSDLIKSFLMSKIDCEDKEKEDQDKKQFMSDWQLIEKMADRSEISLNDLFSIYQYYALTHKHTKNLYLSLKKFYKGGFEGKEFPKTPNKAISVIKKFAEIHEELYDEKDKYLFYLRYTPWTMLWKSILMTARHKNYNGKEKLTEKIFRFYCLCWVAGKNVSFVRSPSMEIIEMIKEDKSVEEISEFIDKKLNYKKHENEKSIIDYVKDIIVSNDIDSGSWCKHLLLIIEYNITDDSILPYIPLDRKIHLEHILPQKYKSNGWDYITDEIADKYMGSGGNITLLSGRKNIKASNKKFSEKIEAYKGKGLYGPNDQRITAFQITQKIIQNNEKYQGEWNENAMRDRKKWFLEELEKVLKIGINAESG